MKLLINRQNVAIIDPLIFVSDTENVYQCEYEFSSDWDGFTKTATFKCKHGEFQVLLEGNTCTIPPIVMSESGNVQFGAFGTKVVNNQTYRYPTTWSCELFVSIGSIDYNAPVARPDVYAQILDIVGRKQDTLVSGQNIKTINNQSILGAGNLDVSAMAPVSDVKVNGTSVVTNKVAAVTVPTELSDLTEDATHRTVSDAEKSTWNGKTSVDDQQTSSTKTWSSSKINAELSGKAAAVHDHDARYFTRNEISSAYRTSAAQDVIDETIVDRIADVEDLIPTQATTSNQLADKNFVSSSIETNVEKYVSNNGRPFNSLAELQAYTGVVTNNDYAFVIATDNVGNKFYDKYRATVSGSTITWTNECRLSNASFTSTQFAAINSGVTAEKVSEITSNTAARHTHSNASVLAEIDQEDIDKWDTVTGKYVKPDSGIPKTDLIASVQTSLGLADTALQEHQSLAAYRTASAQDAIDLGLDTRLDAVEGVIPSQATATNQLADKAFVNSSIATNTGSYISNNGQPFTSLAQLQAYTGTVNNNDYAFVTGNDGQGNTYFDRYKATVNGTTVTWAMEYRLNNSSFTAVQWAAINSTATAEKINSIANKVDKVEGKGLSTNDYDNTEKQKVADAYGDKHTHSNKSLLDTYDQTNSNISDAVTKKHSHDNKSVLDIITSALTSAWSSASTWVTTNGATVLSHISNATIHVTGNDKTSWNEKSVVSVSASGTSAEEVQFITINGVEKKLAGGDEAAWGNITGNLSDQTDLNTALAAKAPQATTYTKTEVNSEISRLDGRVDNLQNLGRYLALWDCTIGKPTTNPTTLPYTYKAGDYYRVGAVAGGYNHSVQMQGTAHTTEDEGDYSVNLIVNLDTATELIFLQDVVNALISKGYNTRKLSATGSITYGSQTKDISYIMAGGSDYVNFYDANELEIGYAYSFLDLSDTVTAVTVNYRPNGSTYNNIASTTVETGVVSIGDVYFYDGTSWDLQINHDANAYTKTESDALFATKVTTYTKTEVDSALATKENKIAVSASEPTTSVDGDMWFDTDADGSELPVVVPTEISDAFDATHNYSINDLCIYNNQLYEFNVAHSAGAWIGSDATLVTIDDVFAKNTSQSLNTTSKTLVGAINEIDTEKQNKTDNSLYNLDEQGRVVQSILAVDTKVGDKADTTALTAEATARANADSGKVDKLVTSGQKVYSHNGATQGEMDVASAVGVPIATAISSSSTNSEVPSAKAVYDEINEPYELIETITLSEDTASVMRNADLQGNSYNFEAVNVDFKIPQVNFTTYVGVFNATSQNWSKYIGEAKNATNTTYTYTYSSIFSQKIGNKDLRLSVEGTSNSTTVNKIDTFSPILIEHIPITALFMKLGGSFLFPSGTVITIYGIRR